MQNTFKLPPGLNLDEENNQDAAGVDDNDQMEMQNDPNSLQSPSKPPNLNNNNYDDDKIIVNGNT